MKCKMYSTWFLWSLSSINKSCALCDVCLFAWEWLEDLERNPCDPKKGTDFTRPKNHESRETKTTTFIVKSFAYRLQKKKQNPKKPMKDTWNIFLQNMFPLFQPRHSIHDINSTTNSTLPRSDYKGKVTVIHFYTSWGLPERTTKVFLIWRKTQTLGVFGWNGYDSTVFQRKKLFFFGTKAVGSTFRWEVIIHLVGFEWWPYLLWKASNSPRKNSDQQQMRLEKCLTRQLPSVLLFSFAITESWRWFMMIILYTDPRNSR